MKLGDRIQKLRMSKGLSQELLAMELNVSKTAVRKWEQNQAKPGMDNLLLICDYFQIDIYNLFEGLQDVNFEHAKFSGRNYVVNPNNSTINYSNSPEILELLIKNQQEISQLCEKQNKLMDRFFKK